MQRRIAGLAAALAMLALPQATGAHDGSEVAPVQPPAATQWALQGVPTRARAEPLNAISRGRPAEPPPESVFPVRGRHDMGTAVNGFGGGRGHQGHDIFAACGTRVVAARAGRVVEADTGGAEGNYVVMAVADGHQHAYLHLLRPKSVKRGDRLEVGDDVGRVGQTGNAQGCHLHFELWTAPGRFTGGRAIDPRPALERWASKG